MKVNMSLKEVMDEYERLEKEAMWEFVDDASEFVDDYIELFGKCVDYVSALDDSVPDKIEPNMDLTGMKDRVFLLACNFRFAFESFCESRRISIEKLYALQAEKKGGCDQ